MTITSIGAACVQTIPNVAELDPQPASPSPPNAGSMASAPGPNPRVTFDAVLGVTILQFYDASPASAARYPEATDTPPDARPVIIA